MRRGGEVRIAVPQMGEEALPDEDLRAVLRLHDAADHATILRVNIGPDRTEGDPFLLDERAVVGRGGDDRLVATLRQLPGESEIGIDIPERAEARDDDALSHAGPREVSASPMGRPGWPA